MLHLYPALVNMAAAPTHPPAEKGVRFVADYVDGMSAAMVEIFGPRGRDAAKG